MILLEYAFKHMLRRSAKSLGMLVLPIILTLLLCCLNGLVNLLEAKTEYLMDTLTVTTVVSDITGSNQSNLMLDEIDVYPLDKDGPLNGFVEVFSYAREVYYSISEEGSPRYLLAGVSDLKGSYSNFLMSTELDVLFAKGWDKSAFLGDAQICVINESLLTQGYAVGDVLVIRLSESEWEESFATLSLTIIGSFAHNIDGLLLCPWQTLKASLGVHEKSAYVQALSFTMKDNRTLDEFREKAALYYEEIDYLATRQPHVYALTIHDEILKESVLSVGRSIKTVRIIIPIIISLSLLIGGLTGLLQVYNRRRELFLLCLQGTYRRERFLIILSEACMLTLAGVLIGRILSPLVTPFLSISGMEGASAAFPVWQGIALLFSFIAGYTFAAILLIRGSLLQSVKEVA